MGKGFLSGQGVDEKGWWYSSCGSCSRRDCDEDWCDMPGNFFCFVVECSE